MVDEEIQVPAGLSVSGLIGRRYLARVIDSFAIVCLIALEVALFSGGSVSNPSLLVTVVVTSLIFATVFCYGSVLESSPWQATVGKKIMGMRVYRAGGGRLSFRQALARNAIKDGPFVVLGLLPFGRFLTLVWLGAHVVVLHRSPVYQAIHDRIAGSLVAAPEETTRLNLSV